MKEKASFINKLWKKISNNITGSTLLQLEPRLTEFLQYYK